MKRFLTLILIVAFSSIGLVLANGNANEMPERNHEGIEMEMNQVIPHLHIGGGYQTVITVFNPGTGEQVAGTLIFYTQNGERMSVEVNGELSDEFYLTLPEGGMSEIVLGNPEEEARFGWAIFNVDTTASTPTDTSSGGYHDEAGQHLFLGVVYRRYYSNGYLATQVGSSGMRYMSGFMKGFAAPVFNNANSSVGIAVVNSSENEITVSFLLKNTDGTLAFEKEIVLPAGNQRVYLLSDLMSDFEGINNFKGILEIRGSEDGIVPLVLINSDGIQTSVPLVPIPDAMEYGGGMM